MRAFRSGYSNVTCEAQAYQFTPDDLEKVRVFRPIYGTPTFVRRALTALAAELDADELIW